MAKKSTRLQALQDIFEENGISADMIEHNDTLVEKIKGYADTVPDYRHPSYVKHLLGDIIMITFFAILGNADEWGEIESFAKKKEKWLRKYLELPYGIPTDDTFRIVIGNINTDHFFEMTVLLLMQSVNDIICLSGKETDLHEKIFCLWMEKRAGAQNGKAGAKARPKPCRP